MQIKAFLSGEEGTNGVCDLLPRFFGAVWKTQGSAPPLCSLSLFFFFEEFLPARFGAIPLENLGCLEGDKHLEAGVCEEGRIHLIPAFPRQQSHGGSEPAHICTWEMKF